MAFEILQFLKDYISSKGGEIKYLASVAAGILSPNSQTQMISNIYCILYITLLMDDVAYKKSVSNHLGLV